MNETVQMIVFFIIMLLLLFYARKFRAKKMIQARDFIINDLRSKGALSADSAVELNYAHRSFLRIGLRDDRPRVLRQMIQYGIVVLIENNRFFLNESAIESLSRNN